MAGKVTEEMKKRMRELKKKGKTKKAIAELIEREFGVRVNPKTVDYHTNPKARANAIKRQKERGRYSSDAWARKMRQRMRELVPYIHELMQETGESNVRRFVREKLEFPDGKTEELIEKARKYGERLEKEYYPRLQAHKLYLDGKEIEEITKELKVSKARARHLIEKSKKDAWHVGRTYKKVKDPAAIADILGLPVHYVEGHIKLIRRYGVTHRKRR